MKGYVARRLMLAAGQLALLAVLVFVLTALLPGDAAKVTINHYATPGQIAALREQMGLDQPLLVRFLHWAGSMLAGDPGTSLVGHGRPVAGIVSGSVGVTAVLAGLTLLGVVPLAFVIGLASAVWEGGRLDKVVSAVTLGLNAIPDFVLALTLVAVFSLQLGWLPATWVGVNGGDLLSKPALLILPVTVLLSRNICLLSRQVRAGTVSALHAGYAVQARRLGVPQRTVLLRHVLPNAAVPGIQELARTGDQLLGGVLVVEAVFAIPGAATALVDGVQNRDVPTVQALTLLLAAVAMLVNLAADLVCHRLAPRTEVLR